MKNIYTIDVKIQILQNHGIYNRNFAMSISTSERMTQWQKCYIRTCLRITESKHQYEHRCTHPEATGVQVIWDF